MASQRITIAKLAGLSGDVAFKKLKTWFSARKAARTSLWSSDQWPESVRKEVDEFADQIRDHACGLPVCHFVEWVDFWSMGDVISRWLNPANEPNAVVVFANRFEVFAYPLPDQGRLAQSLANAGAQQFEESNWLITRLRDAVDSWDQLVPRATLLVFRQVVGATIQDEDVVTSNEKIYDWLSS